MEELFKVNASTCNRDGICKEVCPVDVIAFSKDGYPIPDVDAEDVCVRCGHCVAVCPTGSFRHRDVDWEKCSPVRAALQPATEQIEHLLRSRRSIRTYKEKPVDRGILQRLLEMARYAPSAHNGQKVKWLVFGNKTELRSLSGITVDWMRWIVETMPERAADLHLNRRIERWESGVDGILRGAPVLIVAHGEKDVPARPPGFVPELDNLAPPLDHAIALTYMELAATGLGLGACWAGYIYRAANTFPVMHEALGLPEGHQCYGAMMVGYPRYAYMRMPPRNDPSITWRL